MGNATHRKGSWSPGSRASHRNWCKCRGRYAVQVNNRHSLSPNHRNLSWRWWFCLKSISSEMSFFSLYNILLFLFTISLTRDKELNSQDFNLHQRETVDQSIQYKISFVKNIFFRFHLFQAPGGISNFTHHAPGRFLERREGVRQGFKPFPPVCQVLLLCPRVITTFPFFRPVSTYL